MAKKVALGKGIASLLQSTPAPVVDGAIKKLNNDQVPKFPEQGPMMVAISEIKPNPDQPRKIFKEKELEELTNSIRENGIIQPLIVSKLERGYELIAGERRFKAAKRCGLSHVPVVVKNATEREKMIMSIIENVQRSDLNCVEEALAYYQLMNDYQLTQEDVAKKLGKERSSVANYLRILKLPRDVIELVQKELLTFGHAKVLAGEKDSEKIKRVANVVVTENLSVRETENLLKKKIQPPSAKSQTNAMLSEKFDQLRQRLEQNTGYHFGIKATKSGAGQFNIKFSNEAEFNDIFEYLLAKR